MQKAVMRVKRVVLAVMLGMGIGCNPVWAQDARPDARLHFSSVSFGLLLGYSYGEGDLDFAGVIQGAVRVGPQGAILPQQLLQLGGGFLVEGRHLLKARSEGRYSGFAPGAL